MGWQIPLWSALSASALLPLLSYDNRPLGPCTAAVKPPSGEGFWSHAAPAPGAEQAGYIPLVGLAGLPLCAPLQWAPLSRFLPAWPKCSQSRNRECYSLQASWAMSSSSRGHRQNRSSNGVNPVKAWGVYQMTKMISGTRRSQFLHSSSTTQCSILLRVWLNHSTSPSDCI